MHWNENSCLIWYPVGFRSCYCCCCYSNRWFDWWNGKLNENTFVATVACTCWNLSKNNENKSTAKPEERERERDVHGKQFKWQRMNHPISGFNSAFDVFTLQFTTAARACLNKKIKEKQQREWRQRNYYNWERRHKLELAYMLIGKCSNFFLSFGIHTFARFYSMDENLNVFQIARHTSSKMRWIHRRIPTTADCRVSNDRAHSLNSEREREKEREMVSVPLKRKSESTQNHTFYSPFLLNMQNRYISDELCYLYSVGWCGVWSRNEHVNASFV